MKRYFSLLLVLVLAFGTLCGCNTDTNPTSNSSSEATTKTFTDSTGRKIELPANIEKIAVSGPLTQIVIFALAPDKLVGVSSAWSNEAEKYIDAKYYNLPDIGQLYGGKGELNLETLLDSGAQVVIDVGEPKGSVAEDLDDLQQQTGIPFVHITATTETMPEAYRKLGELLGMKEEAEKLANYCEKVYTQTKNIAENVTKADVLYILGDAGLNVIASNSYHAEIIDLLCNNLAVLDDPSSKGSGNEVDMEQIINWNPDVIIFAPESIYSTVADMPEWSEINAIKNGAYYEVPYGPYNWMGFPPSVQRYLGMMWLAKLLYPDNADYDLYTSVAEYYELFYHSTLTQEQYNELVANSIGK